MRRPPRSRGCSRLTPRPARLPELFAVFTLVRTEKGTISMADLSKLVDELSTLTVLEAAELAKMLEDKWGVSAAAAVAVAAGPAAGGAAPVEEKTEFDVILAAIGDKK